MIRVAGVGLRWSAYTGWREGRTLTWHFAEVD